MKVWLIEEAKPGVNMDKKETDQIYSDFYDNVNMTPSEIEAWLETENSKKVGQDSGDGESIGRKSAKKIISIKKTKKEDLNSSNYEHMKKVNSYVARHSAQKPEGDIENSHWRYSLKNWGHDPCK